MKLLRRIGEIAYRIDSSDGITYMLGVFQSIALITYRLHSIEKLKNYSNMLFYTFITLQVIVTFILLLRCLIAGKYSTIKLKYNKRTGLLYDRMINERNVSLRSDSVRIMLKEIEPVENIYEAGRDVAHSFYECFDEDLQKKRKKRLKIKDKIQKWCEYDSSSGMGKFEFISFEQDPFRVVLTVSNPFTGTCENGGQCNFLKGYIEGFCERLFNSKNLTSECEWNAESSSCKFIINQ